MDDQHQSGSQQESPLLESQERHYANSNDEAQTDRTSGENQIIIDTVDDGLEKAGSCGRFQIITTLVFLLGYMTGEVVV